MFLEVAVLFSLCQFFMWVFILLWYRCLGLKWIADIIGSLQTNPQIFYSEEFTNVIRYITQLGEWWPVSLFHCLLKQWIFVSRVNYDQKRCLILQVFFFNYSGHNSDFQISMSVCRCLQDVYKINSNLPISLIQRYWPNIYLIASIKLASCAVC